MRNVIWQDCLREIGSKIRYRPVVDIPTFVEILLDKFTESEIADCLVTLEEKSIISFMRSNYLPPFWVWDNETWEEEKHYCYRHGVTNRLRNAIRNIAVLSKGKIQRILKGEVGDSFYTLIMISWLKAKLVFNGG